MENIGTVRDLNGQMIPGFNTLGTILIDENKKDITLADLTVFSNGECRFVTQQELRDYAKKSIKDKKREAEIKSFIESKTNINMIVSLKEQARRVSQSLKAKNPDIKVCHGHDRLSDTVEYYEYINLTLKDEFVSRAKISRNSNKKKLNPKTKKNEFIKLVNVVFSNKELYQIDKLRLKGKTYEQAKCLLEWDTVIINKYEYSVVRITLKKRDGEKIYKNPMLLISNIKIDSYIQAKEIYHIYLLRSKIEAVFKFLKDVLGWEEFQIRDFESIKNIIAICFFIGGYFYEIQSELIEHETIIMICDLAKSKGKVTHYFFLEGLKVLLTAFRVELFRKERGISDELFAQMQAYTGIGV